MKRFFMILAIMPILILAACSDDENPITPDCDSPGTVMFVSIVDDDGADLLNPESENSLYGTEITVTYESRHYELDWNVSDYLTPITFDYEICRGFRGLTFGYELLEDENGHLQFGEKHMFSIGDFCVDKNYDKQFTLTWDNGNRVDEFRLVNKMVSEYKHETRFYHNGVECDRTVVLVK